MWKRCFNIFRLALPVMISQVGLIIVNFADNVMVGHYSTESLASASFVINVFNVPMMCLMGFSYGLTPLIGLLFARRRNGDIGHMLRAGLKVNVIAGAILTSVMLLLYPLLPHMGQPEELMHLIRPFYLIYVAGLLPMTVFNAFAQWSYAVRNTSMPMWILLACNAANIVGNYALIFGHWGAPELGLVGAGLSTLFARVAAPVAIVLIFFLRKSGKPYRATFRERMCRSERRALMGKVTRTSWPVALQMTFETCAFSLCAVLAGWLGTISLAAFQIIVVVGMLGFCIYYSVGTAIAVLVSNRMGEADGADRTSSCRRVAFDGYVVMLFFAALASSIFYFFGHQVMGLFSDDPEVLALAFTLVPPLILYQLGDATQVTFANALRGTSHVMPMLWIAFVSYAVIGLASSWVLAFPCGLGVYGIVLSFSVSLFTAGALFLRSFLRVTRTLSR